MATTTPNFGWSVPTSTDLVKDGATAIETLGDAIDASLVDLKGGTTGQVLAKNSNTDMDFIWSAPTTGDITGVTAGTGISGGGTSGDVTITNSMATAITTNGDLIYGTGSGTFTRRAIGSTGQVLTVSGGVPAWAAAPTASANWSLVNSGGTALTGASTVTVSGISGADKIMILISDGSSVNASSSIGVRLNTDSGSNYFGYGVLVQNPASYGNNNINQLSVQDTTIYLCTMSNSDTSTFSGYVLISGCNTSGLKVYNSAGSASTGSSGNGQQARINGGYYSGTSTISSISIVSGSGNFDGSGRVYVYTSA